MLGDVMTVLAIVAYMFLPTFQRYTLILCALLMLCLLWGSLAIKSRALLTLCLIFSTILQVPIIIVTARAVIELLYFGHHSEHHPELKQEHHWFANSGALCLNPE
ncbi:hypothetical protein OESDEN_02756 [Oesophagostomum dentatum]|uniref:Uncharacterized protein n=1 Tax=Oesophagostomum dentatum TaxID=61180 RepID=A0A0B1TMF1_OESDE|nr:hypothetical protein OESDEN_02756 [Oesophagostomum dentatum]